jgi:hypothetical protein
MFHCLKCSRSRLSLTAALLVAAAQIGIALIVSGTV